MIKAFLKNSFQSKDRTLQVANALTASGTCSSTCRPLTRAAWLFSEGSFCSWAVFWRILLIVLKNTVRLMGFEDLVQLRPWRRPTFQVWPPGFEASLQWLIM